MSKKTCACCCSKEVSQAPRLCPECGCSGVAVPDETLDALLMPQARPRRLPVTYHFCETPDCPVVYYSADPASRFGQDDLAVRVGCKQTDPPRLLCYCLGHTYESVREEWERTGQSTALEQIETATKAGACRCRTTNPGGACCLPRVREFLAGLEAKPS
jgi:hypothetical protein